MLIATNISKSFGSKTVLSNISIEIKQAEITVLLGESGCGKTTLLRLLALLDKPDKGIIDVDSARFYYDHTQPTIGRKIYPKVTVVFQQLFLWPHLTNKKNILLAINPNQNNYTERIEYLQHLTNELELSDYIDKYPNESSSGQRQRIAIARALMVDPKYLLMDEITASLDNLQTNKIIEILKGLKHNNSLGILFITHNLSVAKRLGDKFAFISKGIIKEYGDKEILENPKTKELKHFLNIAY